MQTQENMTLTRYRRRSINSDEKGGKGRRYCLRDRIDSIPCRINYFAPGRVEERDYFILFFKSCWFKIRSAAGIDKLYPDQQCTVFRLCNRIEPFAALFWTLGIVPVLVHILKQLTQPAVLASLNSGTSVREGSVRFNLRVKTRQLLAFPILLFIIYLWRQGIEYNKILHCDQATVTLSLVLSVLWSLLLRAQPEWRGECTSSFCWRWEACQPVGPVSWSVSPNTWRQLTGRSRAINQSAHQSHQILGDSWQVGAEPSISSSVSPNTWRQLTGDRSTKIDQLTMQSQLIQILALEQKWTFFLSWMQICAIWKKGHRGKVDPLPPDSLTARQSLGLSTPTCSIIQSFTVLLIF